MPTREIYWNIIGGTVIYGFALVAVGFLAWGLYRRGRLWRLGGAAERFDQPALRLRGLLAEVFGQRRNLRNPVPGIAHGLIFYGFLAELIATALVSIQENTGIHFLKGDFYLAFSLFSDLFGILGIIGIGMAIWRRAVVRPKRLDTLLDDWVALGLLLLVFVQGFAVEGLRIAASELQQRPELAPWSPGGYLIALMFQGLPIQQLESIHRFAWWFHAVTAFGFIGYMAFGKLNHIFFGLLNIFTRNLEPSGKLSHPDIEALLDSDPDALEHLGTDRIEQYSWKSLLDLDTCVNCGRCEDVCPATMSGVALSPRKLIRNMRDHLTDVGPGLLGRLANGDTATPSPTAGGPLLFGESGEVSVLEEEIWGCRTCGACQQECPLFIEHIPKIVDMRRHLVMTQAKMGDAAQQFIKNMDDRMHPWTGAEHDREEWFQDLDIKVLGRGDRAEYLLWVGCTGAMIDRNIQVTRALVKVLQAGGVDFAVLGAEESCTGDPARRAGAELTFQICAKTNIEILAEYDVTKIITGCPHCFNSYRNEYPDFGGRYEVIHHTELIDQLIRDGKLRLGGKLGSVTYHDPCYLGRHNGVYDAPRSVLAALSGGEEIRELEKNRSRALCCGAGGGYAWMDDEPEQRINHVRVAQVKERDVDTVAVGCPFCMQMLEDGLNAVDPEGRTRAVDVAELVAEALED